MTASLVNTQDLRYPIGPHAPRVAFDAESRAIAMASIRGAPAAMRRAVSGLDDAQLDTPYRPGGWTVRQVVHHLADAHMVLYTRVRIALTEDNPPVKTWDEVTWAQLPDAASMPIDDSLKLLEAIHARLSWLLESLTPDQLGRTSVHPAWGVIPVDWLADICAWHGAHHTAHVSELRKRNGW